jgi:hypothetical protein
LAQPAAWAAGRKIAILNARKNTMSNIAEQAKKIVGKPYTTSNAAELQRIVGNQAIALLTPGSVRGVQANTTYVITDAQDNVIAVVAG